MVLARASFLWFQMGETVRLTQCEQPDGFVPDNTDCDDLRNLVHPDAIENCNTFYDDDCDGESNWDSLPNAALGCTDYYSDVDLDGYGDPNDMRCACDPEGFFTATNDDDCDDSRDDTHLGATELCFDGDSDGDGFDDLVDNDCDGTADEEDALDCVEYFLDVDGDGYGVTDSRCTCEVEADHTAIIGGDCDDGDLLVNLEQGCELLGFLDNDRALHHVIVPEEQVVAHRFDFNGDGLPDIALSDDSYDSLYTNPGQIMVWLSPFPAQLNFYANENADLTIDPELYNFRLGGGLTTGDFDGDGLDELLVRIE